MQHQRNVSHLFFVSTTFLFNTKKPTSLRVLVFYLPSNGLRTRGETPYYHRCTRSTSVFRLRKTMDGKFLRQPQVFDSREWDTLRVLSLCRTPRYLDCLFLKKKYTKKPTPLKVSVFYLPSDVLLSQGETPNYHRR